MFVLASRFLTSLTVIRLLQVMVTNVTSLLKTVKAVEDEHTRGTQALEATVEAIAQEMKVINYVFDNIFQCTTNNTCYLKRNHDDHSYTT